MESVNTQVENDYDEQFMQLLMKTKENLAKLDIKSEEEEIDNDECDESKFLKFLLKTKECLSSLSIESDNVEEEESDLMFEQFISQQKKQDLSVHLSVEESFSVQSFSSPRTKKSHTLSVEEDGKENDNFSAEVNKSTLNSSFNIYDTESKTNFAKKRNTYTTQLFEYFNRKVFNNRLPRDTPLEWSDLLRRTAGKAHCKCKAGVYSCSIELSSKVLTSFDRLRDTLLHEMCHAAVWIVNKSRCGHGPLWQTWATRCKIILPRIDLPKRCHYYEIEYKYTYKCSKCHYKIGRHSKSIKIDQVVCPYCRSKLVLVKS